MENLFPLLIRNWSIHEMNKIMQFKLGLDWTKKCLLYFSGRVFSRNWPVRTTCIRLSSEIVEDPISRHPSAICHTYILFITFLCVWQYYLEGIPHSRLTPAQVQCISSFEFIVCHDVDLAAT